MAAQPALARQLPAAAATDAKKGVSAWTFDGVDSALAKSGASWYYTWVTGHPGITNPQGVQFVPMIWGAGSVSRSALRQVRQVRNEGHYLLGFNDPDNGGQSKMSPSQAWFALPATPGPGGDGTAGLFRPGAVATRAGRAFEAARS